GAGAPEAPVGPFTTENSRQRAKLIGPHSRVAIAKLSVIVRLTCWLGLVVALASAAVACGDDDESESKTETPTVTASSPTVAPSPSATQGDEKSTWPGDSPPSARTPGYLTGPH